MGAAQTAANRPPSFNEKMKLSSAIYKLTPDKLGHVVNIVDEHCDKAMKKCSPDELEINIDDIDVETFRRLEKYIQESGGSKKRGAAAAAASASSSQTASTGTATALKKQKMK